MSHSDGATPEQLQHTEELLYYRSECYDSTENKPSLEKFKMLRAKLKSTKVDSLYKEQYAKQYGELAKLQRQLCQLPHI